MRPYQGTNHNRKAKPRILHSHLRRRRPTEIPRQQDRAKNGRTGIQIRPQADKLNDANVHDEPGRISELYRSFHGDRQVQHLDHRVEEQESHRENRDYASSPQLCLGSYSDFVLRLHRLSPARPSLWLVSEFSEPSASPESSLSSFLAVRIRAKPVLRLKLPSFASFFHGCGAEVSSSNRNQLGDHGTGQCPTDDHVHTLREEERVRKSV